MTALNVNPPGLASGSVDTFTQNNSIYSKPPILPFGYAQTSMDLPIYSVIGRVTGTNLVVLSLPGATDGSQLPIGVTTRAVVNNDSNSGLVDSNSEAGADLNGVAYAKDGEWNYDLVNKDSGWTFETLKAAVDRTPLAFAKIMTASPGTPSEP